MATNFPDTSVDNTFVTPNRPWADGDEFDDTANSGLIYYWYDPVWKTKASDVTAADLTVSSLNGGPLAGFRNQIINGGFEVFQRNTGSPINVSATSGQYVLDRWRIRSNVIGADTTITAQDITTSNHPAGVWKAIRLQNANVNVSPQSGQFVGIQQLLEQSVVRSLGFGSPLNQSLSVGFYIRSSVAATYTFSIQSATASKSYLFDFAVPADTTNWTYVSHTFETDADLGFLTQEAGAAISLYLTAASNFVGGTNESWNDGELFVTSTATNNFTQIPGATVDLTGFQLEPGPVATPFEHRPIGTELALCQRYYEMRVTNSNSIPEPTDQNGRLTHTGFQSRNANGPNGYAQFTVQFYVEKRVDPSINVGLIENSAVYAGQDQNGGSPARCTSWALDNTTRFIANISVVYPSIGGGTIPLQWTRFGSITPEPYIEINAEL